MRLYASGIDWVAAGLNAGCRCHPAQGNQFSVVIEFAHRLPIEALRQACEEIPIEVLRVLGGQWRRAWHLIPYWQPAPHPIKIPVYECECDTPFDTITTCVNTPLPQKHAVAVTLLHGKEKSCLVWTLSHLLFDGSGAEYFIEAVFNRSFPDNPFEQAQTRAREDFRRFPRFFLAAQKYNVFSVQLNRKIPKRKDTPLGSNSLLRYKTLTFDYGAFSKCCNEKFGLFSFSLVSFAIAAYSLAKTQKEKNGTLPDDVVLMQVSLNNSDVSSGLSKLFFNHWSILPFLWHIQECPTWEDYLKATRTQMNQIIEGKQIQNFECANRLMRILPQSLMGKLASFYFRKAVVEAVSSTITTQRIPQAFAGVPIRNALHIPSMPDRPGLGIFYSVFHQTLNVTIAYREGTIPQAQVDFLTHSVEEKIRNTCHE